MRILVVEDNKTFNSYIKKSLELESYAVDVAFDSNEGENLALINDYDLILLDIMLPHKNGTEICKSLRNNEINIPIIMITAKSSTQDKIAALDSGADDYIVKPFALDELLARIRALLRRPKHIQPEVLHFKDISIDVGNHVVLKDKKILKLTLKEFAVLEYLVRSKNKVINREDILEHCWDLSYESFSNIVDAYIKQLRKKLNDKDEKYIKTIRGLGYQLQA